LSWSFDGKITPTLQHWATKLLPFAGRLRLISGIHGVQKHKKKLILNKIFQNLPIAV
jgi:hypothetical protein